MFSLFRYVSTNATVPPTSMEVDEVDSLPWKFVEASTEVDGTFHC